MPTTTASTIAATSTNVTARSIIAYQFPLALTISNVVVPFFHKGDFRFWRIVIVLLPLCFLVVNFKQH